MGMFARNARGVSYLQNGQLVHLPRARRDHILEYAKLLVHLGSPPPLNQAMGRLPGDLAPSDAGGRGLLLLGCGHLPRRSLGPVGCGLQLLLRLLARLHLDDLPGAGGGRRKGKSILGGGLLSNGRAAADLDDLAGRQHGGDG